MTEPRTSVLYITYDGLLEPLGQSQVLAYLEKLARDYRIHILSFEKKGDLKNLNAMKLTCERLANASITWTPLKYHKSPTIPATAFDISLGILTTILLVIRKRIKVIHARSYVPTMIAYIAKKMLGTKLIFDMRGFWADERVDGGLWPKDGKLYRMTKKWEDLFLQSADHIVTLTEASKIELKKFKALKDRPVSITVIPTCVDNLKFAPSGRKSSHPFVLGYVGSIGTWYLFSEMLGFFKALCKKLPDASLLLLNRNEHDQVREAISSACIPCDKVKIVAVDHAQMPEYVNQMHAGLALIRPCYSKIASAPTKLAEYLACGVPCVGNSGVGDVSEVLETRRVGVSLKNFTPDEISRAVDKLLNLIEDPETPSRCIAAANELFSLERGVSEYEKIYKSLTSFSD